MSVRKQNQKPVYISPKEAAKRLGISNIQLWRWRLAGKGPKWIHLPTKVVYDPKVVDEWVRQRAEGGAR